MKITLITRRMPAPTLLTIAGVAALAAAGCAIEPQAPVGAAGVRDRLNTLQSDSALASKAPVEIREAQAAVVVAEAPLENDTALGEHRVYMADQMVEIAAAKASARHAEEEREELIRKRDEYRLQARTGEADMARRKVAAANDEIEATRASAARSADEAARRAAEANRKAVALQLQIDELEAQATERGLVVTLGDVLFATGQSELNQGGNRTLDKLIAFLNEYPERGVAIEGHTDDVGSLAMNQMLSQRRAEAVQSYLLQHGILPVRLSASGMGETQPVAENDSESGRQQNRRVEVIITSSRPPLAAAVNEAR